MKKYLIYIVPTVLSALLFLIIIQPGAFNMIPYSMHNGFLRGIINESTFIYLFDSLFCVLVWFMLFKITKIVSNGNT